MESGCICDLKFESNSRSHYKLPAHTVFSHEPTGLIRNPKTPCTVEQLAIACFFSLDVNISHDIRWIFHCCSASSIAVFRSSWVRFVFSECNMLVGLKLFPYFNSSMIHLNITATAGIGTTRIGSWAVESAGCS